MQKITIETVVNAPKEKVWECWNDPKHIVNWAFASDDWEAPHAENDVRIGGKFTTRMSAKDKSAGFDFEGVYTNVKNFDVIEYDMIGEDKRHVEIHFIPVAEGTKVIQTFDAENINSEEMQRKGWQAILNNFKKYTEKSI